MSRSKNLCRLTRPSVQAVCFCRVCRLEDQERRLCFLTPNTMIQTTDTLKLVCIDCFSTNCVSHHWDNPVYGQDQWGECLECGSLNTTPEESPVWWEMVNRGLVAEHD